MIITFIVKGILSCMLYYHGSLWPMPAGFQVDVCILIKRFVCKRVHDVEMIAWWRIYTAITRRFIGVIFYIKKQDKMEFSYREKRLVCRIIRTNSWRSMRASPLRSAASNIPCSSSSLKFKPVCWLSFRSVAKSRYFLPSTKYDFSADQDENFPTGIK